MSVLYAATYPARTVALVTFGILAKRIWSPDYPWAPTPEQRQKDFALVEREWDGRWTSRITRRALTRRSALGSRPSSVAAPVLERP
jgi:hypothetical protein